MYFKKVCPISYIQQCITRIGKTYDAGWNFIVLRAGRTHFGIFDGHFLCLFYFVIYPPLGHAQLGIFLRVFLLVILLYSVLSSGHTNSYFWGKHLFLGDTLIFG